jgi:2,4-dienoyl-CoA reductase-like NADH-dependent reductase (Old Yellow Enzyme family)
MQITVNIIDAVQAAMAESLAPGHDPNQIHRNVYKEWAKGGWGLILTGL